MEALVEQIPQTGNIQLTFQISARFNYSAVAAQRLVRRFVADEISYMLRADSPVLVAATRVVWRVPIVLALPTYGAVGQVGSIDVDIETGSFLVTSSQITEIGLRAREIADRYSESTTSTTTT